jgi:Secretion system C-terminal sorting domain
MKSTKPDKQFIQKFSVTLLIMLGITGILFAQTGGANYVAGPNMMRAKIFPPATLLDNGKVITFGGREVNFVSCSYSDLYDPTSNTFTESAMNYPHDGAATIKLADGRYFLVGGAEDLGIAPGYSTTEMYNPTTNTFDTKAGMIEKRCNVSGAQLVNGKVLIVGAWYNNNGAANAEIYDTSSNAFVAASGPLVQPRAQPLVLPTNDGGAVIAGGYPTYGGSIYTAVEYFSSATNTFTTQSSEVIPADPGWLLYSVYTKPLSDLRMSNGNYVLLASRGGASGAEYALLTFDPATKLFSKFVTAVPLKDSLTDGGFFDVILNKADNFAYLMGVDSATDPNKLSLITVNLSTGEAFHPTNTFTMPASEYFYAAYTYMPAKQQILVQGINSTNAGYFTGTNKTYLLTPQITLGVNNSTAQKDFQISSYPNPAQNELNIVINNSKSSSINISLFDMLGREMIQDKIKIVNEGITRLQYPTQHLSPGIYNLVISSESQKITERIIIAK